jgi:membrane protease subunit (stomatin/prohibitin family)
MSIFERIKYEPTKDNELVWKFPTDQITTGSQLIVQPTQIVIFRKDGNNVDYFESGSYTLSTNNLPILQSMLNIPFGGKTPFTAEVWFVNLAPKMDLKWGTSSPIPLIDQKYGVPVNIRAFGQWGIQVDTPLIFISEMVGARNMAKTEQIHEYFMGQLRQDISEAISSGMVNGLYSVFNINAYLSEIVQKVQVSFRNNLARFGINLTNFSIDRIGIPQEEIEKMQNIMLKKMEVDQLSTSNPSESYRTIKVLDAYGAAASNQGGAVLPVIAQMNMANGIVNSIATQNNSGNQEIEGRLLQLKRLFEAKLISQEDFDKKRSEILGDL